MKRYIVFCIVAVLSWQGVWSVNKQQTLVMVGDGTMANAAVESSARGWGQLFSTYLTDMDVVNLAQPGMSVRHLTAEPGALDSLLMPFGKKDVLLIQFGQNDLRETNYQQYSPVDVFIQRLSVVITAAQEKKMYVILCTPLAVPFYMDGQLIDRLGAYPQAIRRLAEQKQLPLVDMEAVTKAWLTETGEDGAKAYYVDLDTNPASVGEYLLNEKGAQVVSRMAEEQLKGLNLKYLNKVLK